MIGDPPDIVARLKAVLPSRWFPDSTPTLDAVLNGLATTWSALYDLLATVRTQTRLATATDSFLGGISTDFFGSRLPRHVSESDPAFRNRLGRELLRDRATRKAVVTMLSDLTGRAPIIFEPALPADTGGYNSPSLAYGAAGGWGSLVLPFQCFITAYRPHGSGIATIAGYGTPGPLARANLAMVEGQVTDADIMVAITSVLPTAAIAWTRITN